MTIIDNGEDETQLHAAARLNNIELVRQALGDGFDVNAVGISGWTPVHEVASSGNCAILRLLLRNGGDPNIQDHLDKCSSLHLAARNGHLDAVKLLVRNGARLDLRNAERKTPQEVAEEDDCIEYLERKRMESVVRQESSDLQEQTVKKLYDKPRTSQQNPAPVVSSSSRSVKSESSGGGSTGKSSESDQDPYDIGLSFDFDKQYLALKIHISHVKNLKLPAGHNFSHLYVKTYLLPSKNPSATKRKTSQLKIESSGYNSNRSSASSGTESIDSTDSGIGLEERMTRMMMSTLKKRPSLSPKKKKKAKDSVKCMVQHDELDSIVRVSAVFNEDLTYDTVSMSKVDLAACEIVITVCGRNSWTSSGQPIVSVKVPLSSAAHNVPSRSLAPQYHVTDRPSRGSTPEILTQDSDRPQVRSRRSVGWGAPDLSQSVPHLEQTSKTLKDQTFSYTASTNDVFKSSKRNNPFKFLKADLRHKSSTNDRYKRKSRRESIQVVENATDAIASTSDASSTEFRVAERSDEDQNEVKTFHIPEPLLADKYRGREHDVPSAQFLRYSRAFQPQASGRSDDSDTMSIEDLDDNESPYAVAEMLPNTRITTRARLNMLA